MNSNRKTGQQGIPGPVRTLALAALIAALAPAGLQAQDHGPAFTLESRSTVETIPFPAIGEDVLAETVIEGGLEAPAAGVPVQPGESDDFYLNPLAFEVRDERADLGRSEIPVDIRFSNPKVVPGQTHSNHYRIRPPENRSYEALNVNMVERP
ncbi:MAG TPA: hypothetical protein VKY53_08130 [Marinobacter sp.]|nr:hypothetical protein [Marinobacter sp.]